MRSKRCAVQNQGITLTLFYFCGIKCKQLEESQGILRIIKFKDINFNHFL